MHDPPPHQYRVTRALAAGSDGSYFPRDLAPGDLLFKWEDRHGAGALSWDPEASITLCETPGGPGYEVPRSAVERVRDQSPGTGPAASPPARRAASPSGTRRRTL